MWPQLNYLTSLILYLPNLENTVEMTPFHILTGMSVKIKWDNVCRGLSAVSSMQQVPIGCIRNNIPFEVFEVQCNDEQPCSQVPQAGRLTRPGCRRHCWGYSVSVPLLHFRFHAHPPLPYPRCDKAPSFFFLLSMRPHRELWIEPGALSRFSYCFSHPSINGHF